MVSHSKSFGITALPQWMIYGIIGVIGLLMLAAAASSFGGKENSEVSNPVSVPETASVITVSDNAVMSSGTMNIASKYGKTITATSPGYMGYQLQDTSGEDGAEDIFLITSQGWFIREQPSRYYISTFANNPQEIKDIIIDDGQVYSATGFSIENNVITINDVRGFDTVTVSYVETNGAKASRSVEKNIFNEGQVQIDLSELRSIPDGKIYKIVLYN